MMGALNSLLKRAPASCTPFKSPLSTAPQIPVKIDDLRKNIYAALRLQGHDENDSDIITNVLMFAELRSNNQGIVKLVSGALKPSSDSTSVEVVYETPVSAKVDGGNKIGMVVVSKCVDLAVSKAKHSGVGVVGCSNYASATGALGVWAKSIAQQGMVGIVMSQCQEYVAPYGSYEPIFGTNPIAIGIPTSPRPQVLDMATSASAYYGLVMAKEEGKSIPNDIAYDSKGYPTTNPADALNGALRVFDRNFKGSHIALMVELLAGALTGASMENKAATKNWGSLVIAIDPIVFGPDAKKEFESNAMIMCHRVKNAKRLPGEEGKEIFLPGERGDTVEAENLVKGTLEMSSVIYDQLLRMISEK